MDPALTANALDEGELLRQAQNTLVKKITEQASAPGPLTDAQIRIYSGAIATFQKVALQEGRNAAYLDRTSAYRERTEVQRQALERRDEALKRRDEIARINAEAARIRARAQVNRAYIAANHPQTRDDPDDPTAPYGRKENGDAYTQEEFNQSLNQAIKEIWGLPPVNPRSYLPHELVPGPDGKLVPFRELRGPWPPRPKHEPPGTDKNADPTAPRQLVENPPPDPENPFESQGESPIRFRQRSSEVDPGLRPAAPP